MKNKRNSYFLFLAVFFLFSLPQNLRAGDAGISSLLAPQSGCGLSSAEAVTVRIQNFGSDTIFGLDAAYSIDFGMAVVESVPDTLAPGAILDYTFSTLADLSFAGFFYIFDTWTALSGDTNTGNDTLAFQIVEHYSSVTGYPHFQNFDNGGFIPLGWVQETSDGPQDWDFNSGSTQTGGTGPSGDHTSGSGFYAYVEDSNRDNQAVSLISPCFDISALSNPRMSVWYYSNESGGGSNPSNVNELHLDIYSSGSWILDVIPPIGHVGNAWEELTLELNPWAGGVISFRFRVNNANFTGTHDIAIDDFEMRDIFDNDLAAAELLYPSNQVCGDDSLPVRVVILNQGAQDQTGFPVGAVVGGAFTGTISTIYPGTLSAFTADTFVAGFLDASAGGNYSIKAFTGLNTDQDISNDSLPVVSLNIQAQPAAPGIQDVVRCDPGPFVFHASVPAGTKVNWYDAASGGSLLASGTTYITPSASSPFTIYADATPRARELAGPANNTFGPGGNFTQFTNQRGILFNANRPFVLDSVLVYPNNSGNVQVNLFDAANQVIGSANVPVISFFGQPVYIPVGFNVPAGTGYSITAVGTNTGGLYRNQFGAQYPYISPSGAVSLTGPITVGGPGGGGSAYYFFYDWRITVDGCTSERVAANGTFITGTPAMASFTPQVMSALSVQFTNGSSGGSPLAYAWDFGDGNTSSLENPLHTYASSGNYPVKLVVSNTCGSDSFSTTVPVFALTVDPAMADNFRVFPVPARDFLFIEAEGLDAGTVLLLMTDMQGREVRRLNLATQGSMTQKVDVSGLTTGLYQLRVIAGDRVGVLKLMVEQK